SVRLGERHGPGAWGGALRVWGAALAGGGGGGGPGPAVGAGRLSGGGVGAGGSPCFGSEPVISPALATVAFPAAALAAAVLAAAGAASWRGAGAGPNRFDTEVGASSWLLGTGAPAGLAAVSMGGIGGLRTGVSSACA